MVLLAVRCKPSNNSVVMRELISAFLYGDLGWQQAELLSVLGCGEDAPGSSECPSPEESAREMSIRNGCVNYPLCEQEGFGKIMGGNAFIGKPGFFRGDPELIQMGSVLFHQDPAVLPPLSILLTSFSLPLLVRAAVFSFPSH